MKLLLHKMKIIPTLFIVLLLFISCHSRLTTFDLKGMVEAFNLSDIGISNTESKNAYYCLINNRIVVTMGMIKILNEDQLATVLGHEIAHSRGITDCKEADILGAELTRAAGYNAISRSEIMRLIRRN